MGYFKNIWEEKEVSAIDDIIDGIIRTEGGYANDANDSGGETKFGITVAVARANGYTGAMRDLPLDVAREIYRQKYVVAPGFDKILSISQVIAEELVDTGVNMGPQTAVKFLQRALNAFNSRGKIHPDLKVDGDCGAKTVAALSAYLVYRKRQDGERVLFTALNVLQGARYIELAESRPTQEDFIFGWIRSRVMV